MVLNDQEECHLDSSLMHTNGPIENCLLCVLLLAKVSVMSRAS